MTTIFNTRVNLDASVREQMVKLLNVTLATAQDLRTQAKQAHWNVKGPQFAAVHQLFDDVACHAAEWADDLAERAVTLGGYATGTARLAAEISRIPEYDLKAVDGAAHVRALADQLGRFSALLREAIGTCRKTNEPGTEDLVTTILREAEKDMWFLEAHIQS